MPTRRASFAVVSALLALVACSPSSSPPTEAPVASVSLAPPAASGDQSSGARVRPTRPGAEAGGKIAPLAMVRVERRDGASTRETYLRLLPTGQIIWGKGEEDRGASPMFQLREPGCLYITGQLFAEYFGSGQVWLRGEGRLKPVKGGNDSAVAPADFEFEGDAPDLDCARTMLPILFFGTMRRESPVAGPAKLDPESRCAESVPWPEKG